MNRREPLRQDIDFTRDIENELETIGKLNALLNEPATNASHKLRLLNRILLKRYHIMVIKYSRGDAPRDIIPDFPKLLDAIETYQNVSGQAYFNFRELDGYVTAIQVISLGILLKTPREVLERTISLIGNRGKDALYDLILEQAGFKASQGGRIIYAKPYGKLYEFLQDPQPQLLKEYLDSWYSDLKYTYWHNLHKAADGFFGYWSFDAALALKLSKLDPALFAESQYLPKDMI